jgi:hypothetical protein
MLAAIFHPCSFPALELMCKEFPVKLAYSRPSRNWFVLLPPERLLPHEHHDPDRARDLADEIRASGIWAKPLLIEAKHLIILDGHHRREAARRLGLEVVPVLLISYDDPRLTLTAWRPGQVWSREEVIDRALTRNLCPIKSTRHRLDPEPPTLAINLLELSTISHSAPKAVSHIGTLVRSQTR